jgi:RimJ/RimL family protein N-acetyltransferase
MPRPRPLPLETARLVLDRPQAEDAAEFFAVIDRHRDALGRWLEWPQFDHLTPEQSRTSLSRRAAMFDDEHPDELTIRFRDKASGEIVGATGMHDIDRTNSACETGYWVRPDRQNGGLCTEAMRAHLTALLTPQAAGGWGFRRVYLRCDAANAASAAIPRKLGMRHEGTFVQDVRRTAAAGFRDTLQFAALSHEWDAKAGRVQAG